MSITVQSLREYVWAYFDVDSVDIPDSLIDTWIREGFNRIIRRLKDWSFYELTQTLNSVAGTASYAMPTATVGGNTSPLTSIVAINGPHGPLQPLEDSGARIRYYHQAATSFQGHPEAYSIWNNQITLWPTPDGVYVYTVTGYRSAVDWLKGGAGALPDFPDHFADVLRDWVMYRAHMHEQDIDEAADCKASFADGVAELVADDQTDSPTAVVLNGGVPLVRPLDRPRLPWE